MRVRGGRLFIGVECHMMTDAVGMAVGNTSMPASVHYMQCGVGGWWRLIGEGCSCREKVNLRDKR